MPQSLDDIMSGRGDASPAEQPAITDAERAANPIGASQRERDQQGRFARKEDEAHEPEPQAEGDQPDADQRQKPGTVPQRALQAERQKRQERDDELAALRRQFADLERRVAVPQAPQPIAQPQAQPEGPPVFWEKPEETVDYRVRSAIDPVTQQIQNMTLAYSQRFATQEHGAEAVQASIQALAGLRQTNPAEYQRLEVLAGRSMDPVGDVVRWHKAQRTLQEVGNDPEAWRASERERIRQELLAEMDGGAPRQQTQQPAAETPRLPTSFASRPSGGPRGGAGYGGPRSLSEIMPRG